MNLSVLDRNNDEDSFRKGHTVVDNLLSICKAFSHVTFCDFNIFVGSKRLVI